MCRRYRVDNHQDHFSRKKQVNATWLYFSSIPSNTSFPFTKTVSSFNFRRFCEHARVDAETAATIDELLVSLSSTSKHNVGRNFGNKTRRSLTKRVTWRCVDPPDTFERLLLISVIIDRTSRTIVWQSDDQGITSRRREQEWRRVDEVETKDSVRTGGATFGYARRQAGSGVPGPGGVMSCSEVMYQYYPYLYQRPPPPPPPHPTHPHTAPHTHPHANPHAAHDSPTRSASFQSFSAATATHQYDRVSEFILFVFLFFLFLLVRSLIRVS